MYEIQLTDSTGTMTMPELYVPLTVTTLEGAVDVQTLSFDVYTDFITQKRLWTHTWAFLSESEFDLLKGYYDRQFTSFSYPELSIAADGVSDVVVRMTLSPKNIIDNCGTVSDVTVTFRETKQLGS